MPVFPEVDITAHDVGALRSRLFVIPGSGDQEVPENSTIQAIESLADIVRAHIDQARRDIVKTYVVGFSTGCYFGLHVQGVLHQNQQTPATAPDIEAIWKLSDPSQTSPVTFFQKLYKHAQAVRASFPNYGKLVDRKFPISLPPGKRAEPSPNAYARLGACAVIELPNPKTL